MSRNACICWEKQSDKESACCLRTRHECKGMIDSVEGRGRCHGCAAAPNVVSVCAPLPIHVRLLGALNDLSLGNQLETQQLSDTALTRTLIHLFISWNYSLLRGRLVPCGSVIRARSRSRVRTSRCRLYSWNVWERPAAERCRKKRMTTRMARSKQCWTEGRIRIYWRSDRCFTFPGNHSDTM